MLISRHWSSFDQGPSSLRWYFLIKISSGFVKFTLQNQTSDGNEYYIYGAMDFSEPQKWHISRDDISFESKLNEGHFVIYKASLKDGNGKTTVVAKTLKGKISCLTYDYHKKKKKNSSPFFRFY